MDEAPAITLPQLKGLVSDPDELKKGTEVFDRGGLKHLARHANKVFADADGSGAQPYKVTLVFEASDKVKSRCTCMAARSRPVCKHGAALLVAWARSPGAFTVAEAPPPGAEGTKKKSVKTSKADASK